MTDSTTVRRLRLPVLLLAAVMAGLLASCRAAAPESLTVDVVAEYPHDDQAFTQGLLFHEDRLYESTGLVGRSSLRQVDLATGAVIRQRDIPAPFFAAGLTLVGEELQQLTYTSGEMFRWDLSTFESTGSASYQGEGWGLCYDGKTVWMSDGSSNLVARDPATFAPLSTLAVTDNGAPVVRLNELECVDGSIYANIWLTDDIVKIEPASGHVTARIDASPLRESLGIRPGTDAVLNGIAYQPDEQVFYLTGKLWPKLFAVRFVPTGE